MPRIPAPIHLKSPEKRGLLEIQQTFRIISPLFGGGVWVDSDEEKRQIKNHDEITPVRGNSLRGQLRFWWRATHGVRLGSLKEMRKREDELWGNASTPGQINLRITGKWNPRALPNKNDLAYAAFPLQPKGGMRERLAPGTLHQVNGEATLILTYPQDCVQMQAGGQKPIDEIRDTLDAWLAFGGLGGRTRRGFGSVSDENAVDPQAILKRLSSPDNPPSIHGVSSLFGAKIAILSCGKNAASEALEAGLNKLRSFRQGPNIGRNQQPGNQRPGRSFWPEPDEIRRLTGQASNDHSVPFVAVKSFPRAAFGMPIIFQFKGGGEPATSTLVPVGAERRASPLIIRPFKNKAGTYDVMALVLHDPAIATEECELAGVANPVRTTLTSTEAALIRPLSGNADVLQAFLQFFK